MKYRFFLLFPVIATLPFGSIRAARTDEGTGTIAIDSSGLSDLAAKPGLVGDVFKLKYATALLNEGTLDQALKFAGRATEEGSLGLWKRILTAAIHEANGAHREALALLKESLPPPRPELSFGVTAYEDLYRLAMQTRSAALKALGQNDARERGELAVLSFGNKMWDNAAESSNTTGLSVEQRIRLLHRLHFSYQFKKTPGLVAVSDIQAAGLTRDEKCGALYDLGDSLRYNAGQGALALEAFSAMGVGGCSDDLKAKALYWQGVLSASAHDASRMERAFSELYKNYPDHRLADDAVSRMRDFYEKSGNAGRVAEFEKKLMGLRRGDMKNEFAFNRGYEEYKRHNYKKAEREFARATAGDPTLDESYPRVLYWQARALEKSGSKEAAKAKAIYKRLGTEFPFSYYAVLAENRLGTVVKVPSLPELSGSEPANAGEAFAAVDALNRMGFHDEAADVMDLAIHFHPEWEDGEREFIARQFIECHNYRKALDIASAHFDTGVYGPTTGSTDPLFSAFYPRAYARQTSDGYARTSLPRGAIEGIMREESLFQANARSWVGATGLMQLMPATAQMVRRKVSGGESFADLTDPLSNIILGSTYLNDMRSFFDGQLPLAIMAYNAGPGNVKKWLSRMADKDLDEFVEDIPLSETRGYVKRVLRSMQVYGALYQEPFFKKPFFDFDVKVAMR
jgi:soluble lytic murein transglycosylase-like protein